MKKSNEPKMPKRLTGKQLDKAYNHLQIKIEKAMEEYIEFAVFHGHTLPNIEQNLKLSIDNEMCWYKNQD